MTVNTPDNSECSNCYELESTECIVEEQSIPSLGLPSGSRLNIILKYLDKKIKDFASKFKKLIYNVTPIFDTGIPLFTYTDDSCSTTPLNMNMPLFLNGSQCYEYGNPPRKEDNFIVAASMGVLTFYDSNYLEITDQEIIDSLTQLIIDGEVTPICCPACELYTGNDVDCGSVNLATLGDTLEDILGKICTRFGTLGEFYNILTPNDSGDIVNITYNTTAAGFSIPSVEFSSDRVGCSSDITITIDSLDGFEFGSGTVITILDGTSTITDSIVNTGVIAPGVYNSTFTWESCSLIRVQNITFNLS